LITGPRLEPWFAAALSITYGNFEPRRFSLWHRFGAAKTIPLFFGLLPAPAWTAPAGQKEMLFEGKKPAAKKACNTACPRQGVGINNSSAISWAIAPSGVARSDAAMIPKHHPMHYH
jgi:hypothetical protein